MPCSALFCYVEIICEVSTPQLCLKGWVADVTNFNAAAAWNPGVRNREDHEAKRQTSLLKTRVWRVTSHVQVTHVLSWTLEVEGLGTWMISRTPLSHLNQQSRLSGHWKIHMPPEYVYLRQGFEAKMMKDPRSHDPSKTQSSRGWKQFPSANQWPLKPGTGTDQWHIVTYSDIGMTSWWHQDDNNIYCQCSILCMPFAVTLSPRALVLDWSTLLPALYWPLNSAMQRASALPVSGRKRLPCASHDWFMNGMSEMT